MSLSGPRRSRAICFRGFGGSMVHDDRKNQTRLRTQQQHAIFWLEAEAGATITEHPRDSSQRAATCQKAHITRFAPSVDISELIGPDQSGHAEPARQA